jgi:hypothetical protein
MPGLHGHSRLHLENPRLSPSQTSLKTGEPEDICLVNDECSLNYSLCACHRRFCEDLCRSEQVPRSTLLCRSMQKEGQTTMDNPRIKITNMEERQSIQKEKEIKPSTRHQEI